MISSAICDQSVRAHRESANFSLWRNLRVLIHPKLHSKSCDYLFIMHAKNLTLFRYLAVFISCHGSLVRPLSLALFSK